MSATVGWAARVPGASSSARPAATSAVPRSPKAPPRTTTSPPSGHLASPSRIEVADARHLRRFHPFAEPLRKIRGLAAREQGAARPSRGECRVPAGIGGRSGQKPGSRQPKRPGAVPAVERPESRFGRSRQLASPGHARGARRPRQRCGLRHPMTVPAAATGRPREGSGGWRSRASGKPARPSNLQAWPVGRSKRGRRGPASRPPRADRRSPASNARRAPARPGRPGRRTLDGPQVAASHGVAVAGTQVGPGSGSKRRRPEPAPRSLGPPRRPRAAQRDPIAGSTGPSTRQGLSARRRLAQAPTALCRLIPWT